MKKVVISITFLMLFCCNFYNSATAKDFRKDEIAYAASFISEYEKDKVVDLIQSERKGHITLIIENELIDASGRPNTDYVTAYTVCIDVNKIGWNLVEFKDKLREYASKPQAKTKKKVRRFTENSTLEAKMEVKSVSPKRTSTRSQSHTIENNCNEEDFIVQDACGSARQRANCIRILADSYMDNYKECLEMPAELEYRDRNRKIITRPNIKKERCWIRRDERYRKVSFALNRFLVFLDSHKTERGAFCDEEAVQIVEEVLRSGRFSKDDRTRFMCWKRDWYDDSIDPNGHHWVTAP